jgi:hypothetical protein
MMNRKSWIIVLFFLILYSILNIIGFKHIPPIIILIILVISIPVIIGGLLKHNYFKTHNKYQSAFFVNIVVIALITISNIVLSNSSSIYKEKIGDNFVYVFVILLYLGLVLGIMGVIKNKKINKG